MQLLRWDFESYFWISTKRTSANASKRQPDAIAPNQFILGNQPTGSPSIIDVDEFEHPKRYIRAHYYTNAIWLGWLREYLPALNRRSKWQTPAGQLLMVSKWVWIVEESNHKCNYPTARIYELRYGSNSGLAPHSYAHRPIIPKSSSGLKDVTE